MRRSTYTRPTHLADIIPFPIGELIPFPNLPASPPASPSWPDHLSINPPNTTPSVNDCLKP